MDDLRFQWFKQVVYKALSIDFSDCAFENLLDRDKLVSEYLNNFISGLNVTRTCIFFYCTIEEEEVEVEDAYEQPEESEKIEVSELSESENVESENASIDDKIEGIDNDDTVGNTFSKVDSAEDIANSVESVTKKRLLRGLSRRSTTSLLQIIKKNVLHACLNVIEFIPYRRYVYFLQRKLEAVPNLDTPKEICKIMLDFCEVGSINQHPLISMNKVISCIYLPILEDEKWLSVIPPSECKMDENQLSSAFKEFHGDMEEFLKSNEETILQIEKPIMFIAPNIMSSCTSEELAQEPSFVAEAEELANEWTEMILDVLEKSLEKKPPDRSLLGEINFWKRQKLVLSTCYDHLNKSSIQQTIEILKIAHSDLSKFEERKKEVEKQLKIATDNYSYLSLLEPLMKNLLPEKSFEDTKKAVEDIFLLLKMIWIQSNYYMEIPNMCRLITGIAMLLKEKVKNNANTENLFRKPLPEVKRIVKNSSQLLQFWKDQYLKECENIKKFGGSYWWGFEITVFFTETDHIILVCSDLEKVTVMLEELYNIFNTNLKYFAQNVKGLNILEVRVFGITSRIQYVNFDIFDPSCKAEWNKIMNTFLRDVNSFEGEIKLYLSKMFRSSLSWEDAYTLTNSFNKISTSPAIRAFINKSRDDMLKQFIREIYEKENEFLSYKDEPPHYQGIPKIISSVIWVEDLRLKLAQPMSQICDHSALTIKETEVMERFKKTESLFKEYIVEKYNVWKISSIEMLNKFLQEKVLKKMKQASSYEKNDCKKVLMYQVNFPIYLEEVSIEAKLLEYFGFEIPTAIKNVVLMETVFYEHRHQMRMTLESLKKSISALTDDEISVLGVPIENLCSVLDIGLYSIPWESSETANFVEKVKRGVAVFRSLLSQIQNVYIEIDKQIASLSHCDLFQFHTSDPAEIQTCEEYFGDVESRMEVKIAQILNIHASLHLLLKNLEKITCKTATCEAVQLKKYYLRCEEKILISLLKMTLSNLDYLKDEILEKYIFPYIELASQSKSELVRSSLNRAELIFLAFTQNAVESTRRVIRWLDGTCISVPLFYLEETKEQVEISYYLDICMHPRVKNLVLNILNTFFNFMKKIH